MLRTLLGRSVFAYVLVASLVVVPAAAAHNDGRGFYGATDDKVVTNAGFILIVAFPLFVFLMSMLQKGLEKRKASRMAAQKAYLHDPNWRGGW